MDIVDFKLWHWVAIGVLVGVVAGGIRLFSRGDFLESQARTIGQDDFEHGLVETTASGHPVLERIVVHPQEAAVKAPGGGPASGMQWVTALYTRPLKIHADLHDGSSPMVRAELTTPVKYPAAIPYVPLDGKPRPAGVRQYLDEITAGHGGGAVSYQYAWYERPAVEMGLWVSGSTALIGGLWPVVLGMLVGAGFGPKDPPVAFDPSRFRENPNYDAKAEAAKALAAMDALLALIDANERKLRAGCDLDDPVPRVAEEQQTPAPVRRLDGGPAEPASAPSAVTEKDFAGEFYPTETHASQPASRQPRPT